MTDNDHVQGKEITNLYTSSSACN